jgi:hypothetical protein
MWVLDPIGEEKLVVMAIIKEMTKGMGLHPNVIASLKTIGKNTPLAPTSLTNSLTMEASMHMTAIITKGL